MVWFGVCQWTQWPLYTIVLPPSCWNAKHALTVSDTVYQSIVLPGKQARCTPQHTPSFQTHLITMTSLGVYPPLAEHFICVCIFGVTAPTDDCWTKIPPLPTFVVKKEHY